MAANPSLSVARLMQRSKHLQCFVALSACPLKERLPSLHQARYQSSDVGPAAARPATISKPSPAPKPTPKAVTISKAMRAYVERVRHYDDMMKAEVAEYEIGKRHLANIMGEDPDTFTQDDVDRAIQYLLPSGLFEKKARPMLKDPREIFPKRKAAMFDLDGRPYHWLYFTTLPNYYSLLYEIAWKMEALKEEEDKLIAQKKFDELKDKSLNLLSSQWIVENKFKTMILENIKEKEYKHFIVLMERLATHPLSYLEEEFIMKFRDVHLIQMQALECPQIETDKDGRSYAEGVGSRKQAEAKARVYNPGTGKFSVNGTDLSYFKTDLCRETLMLPLTVSNLLGKVDVEATVEYGGPTGQSGAVRLAVSRALCAFVDENVKEKLRLSGLLTSDPRVKERKKPGQPKARKKFTWKRR